LSQEAPGSHPLVLPRARCPSTTSSSASWPWLASGHLRNGPLELRTAGEIVGPVHPYIGQEALAVGVGRALESDDSVVSHYRGHAHCLVRGTPMVSLLAELFGRDTGLCRGKAAALVSDREHGILVSSGIVGGGIPIAAGAALAAQVGRRGGVVVAFCGDGAFGPGVVHEVLNIATVQRLPLVLVCEHNGYQGATRTEDVFPDTSLVRIPKGHQMPTASVDGNDVEAVTEAAGEAVARARGGGGPTFLEGKTYLTRFHLQFAKPSGERRPDYELAAWLDADPLERLRRRLIGAAVDPARLVTIEEAASSEVENAVDLAREAPWPDADEIFTHVVPEDQ
jgi:TPP-dependent pyruvate/acetoin dehydrogenase alpha subunit